MHDAGDVVVVEGRFTGTFTGPLADPDGDMEPTGEPWICASPTCSAHEAEDHLVPHLLRPARRTHAVGRDGGVRSRQPLAPRARCRIRVRGGLPSGDSTTPIRGWLARVYPFCPHRRKTPTGRAGVLAQPCDGGGRIRTCDQRIRSPSLCPLSYAPGAAQAYSHTRRPAWLG